MWLLLACADPAGKPGTAADTASADDSDTADPGDTADTGAPPNTRCAAPGATYDLAPSGATRSPWATAMAPDLDGGGAPDVLYETWTPEHGIALLRGEDAAFGIATPTGLLPTRLDPAQAGYAVALPGDVDGDGAADVVVTETEGNVDESVLVVSDPRSGGVLAVVTLAPDSAQPGGGPYDADGDGLDDVTLAQGTATSIFRSPLPADGTLGDAATTVTLGLGSGYAPVPADLDGDGIDELLLTELVDVRYAVVRVLPAELAAGGAYTAADLQALVQLDDEGRPPLLLDIDDDGLEELYLHDWDDPFRVHGFAGADVLDAAVSGRTLTPEDASLHLDGADDYLGFHLAPVTDAQCLPGLAVSAHFDGRTYLVDNATLRAGGTVLARGMPRFSGPDWFGYVLAGGGDLDLDGSLDLVIGNRSDTLAVYLSPAKIAASAP